jgi:hypothetical protein
MKRNAARFLLPICGALLIGTWISPSSISAQGLCSGRCFLDYITLQPYCGLSLFGTRICHEGPDYCAEFACPDWATAGDTPIVVAGRCHQEPPTLMAGTLILDRSTSESMIQVISFKDRS